MLSTTHLLASALIVKKISNPYLSLPAILTTHYILDSIPHCDTGTGLLEETKTKKQVFLHTLIDLAFGGSAVFFLFQMGRPFSPLLWFGVILGISPDLAESPAIFLGLQPFPISPLEKLHHRLHRSLKFPLGLIPQIIIILLVIFLR